jgi:hypothetical protein
MGTFSLLCSKDFSWYTSWLLFASSALQIEVRAERLCNQCSLTVAVRFENIVPDCTGSGRSLRRSVWPAGLSIISVGGVCRQFECRHLLHQLLRFVQCFACIVSIYVDKLTCLVSLCSSLRVIITFCICSASSSVRHHLRDGLVMLHLVVLTKCTSIYRLACISN